MRRYSCVLGLVCAATHVFAADWYVSAGGDFQGALNSALPGDTITLQAGATFQGTYNLPKKAGASWITIRSSALAALPPDGVRVTAADAVNMPKLMAFTANPIITATAGAHHYRFQGIEFIPQPGIYNYNLICFGIGNETSVDQLPQYLELDRVYVHGDLNVGTKRGVTLNSRDTTIKNSRISGIAALDQEATAIQGWNGPGPYTIANNYLEASSIGILFGGAVPAINGVVPSDIQVLHNHFFKPLSWKKNSPEYAGKPWWVKNHFEIKNAQRVTIDGNIFENTWEDQQSGFAIVLLEAAEGGAVPWVVDQDITFTNNIIRHAGSGMVINGCDITICGGRRMTVSNNLFEDINTLAWGGYGRLFQVLNQADSINITHNTGFQNGHVLFSDGAVPNTNLVFQNNIAPHNSMGIVGSGIGIGTAALAYYFPGAIVSGNILTNGPAPSYPAGNFFPASMHDVGFVNMGAGDFHLNAGSAYKNKATDGRDIGVDYDALLAATASTVSGNPGAVSISPVIGAPGSATFVKVDTTTQGNWSGVYGANGYAIPTLTPTLPSAARLSFRQTNEWLWSSSATETKALVNPATGTRIAAAYNGPGWFAFELNLDTPQQVALYCLDYDNLQRAQVIDVLDRRTGAILDSRTVTDFQVGKYLVWNLTGDVMIQVSTSWPQAGPAVSGIFLGAPSTTPTPPPPPVTGSATATLIKADAGTVGNWRSSYGSDGYSIATDGVSVPSYAQMTIQGQSVVTWAASTTDTRGLQKAANAADRVAAAWNSATTFTVDLNLTDGQVHTVAFYMLDFTMESRAQTVDILDAASGAVLSTRSITNFWGGQYIVWKLSGHVQVRCTRTGGPNAVLSGVFFGDTGPNATGGSAAFLNADTTTAGNWRNSYGKDGWQIANDSPAVPAYVQMTFTGQSSWTWASSTTDARALQKPANANDRLASTWYSSTSFTVDLNFTDQQLHTVGFYAVDFDNGGRSETIEILDAGTGSVLDTRMVTNFAGGQYLVWKLSGRVRVRIKVKTGSNVVLSGVFFGDSGTAPVSSANSAAFVKADTATHGTWRNVYGGDGYQIANDGTSVPAYAQLAMQGQTPWTWSASTADVNALQKSSNSNDRIASTWYAPTTVTVDLNFTDGQPHTAAFYMIDYDAGNRSQQVQVLDGSTGVVLNTQTVTSFAAGQYLVWTLSGHVQVRFTRTGGANTVVSGIFFGPAGTAPPPPTGTAAAFVKLDTSTQGNWSGVYGAGGYNIAALGANVPAYAQVTQAGQTSWIWAASTADVRGLRKPAPASDRIASTWYAPASFSVDVTITDGKTHSLAVYGVDWDYGSRNEKVEILDATTGAVLDTRTLTNFSGGQYLVWNISGSVRLRIMTNNGVNAVVSALLFGM